MAAARPRRPGVRLSGGEHRGRTLEVPGSARPTEGRVREALFSIWGPKLSGSRVLDLFAGSGGVGLEAAGRGALEVLCVEGDPCSLLILKKNRDLLGEDLVSLVRLRLPAGLAGLAEEGRRFDLIFADPPYDFQVYEDLLREVAPLLAPDGQFVLEHSIRNHPPLSTGPLVRTDQRRYGESALSFYGPSP